MLALTLIAAAIEGVSSSAPRWAESGPPAQPLSPRHGPPPTSLILPRFNAHWGWRAVFLTGMAPAVTTIWIRRKVKEPEAFTAV